MGQETLENRCIEYGGEANSGDENESISSSDTIVTTYESKQENKATISINLADTSSQKKNENSEHIDRSLILSAVDLAKNVEKVDFNENDIISTTLDDDNSTTTTTIIKVKHSEDCDLDRTKLSSSLDKSDNNDDVIEMISSNHFINNNDNNNYHQNNTIGFGDVEPKLVCKSRRLREYFDSLKKRTNNGKSKSLYQFFKTVRTEFVASLLFSLITAQALISLRTSNMFRIKEEINYDHLNNQKLQKVGLIYVLPNWDKVGVQLSNSIVISFTVASLTQIFGYISGCHLTPPISLAVYLKGHISAIRLGSYVLAQSSGSLIGLSLLKFLTSSQLNGYELEYILNSKNKTILIKKQDDKKVSSSLYRTTKQQNNNKLISYKSLLEELTNEELTKQSIRLKREYKIDGLEEIGKETSIDRFGDQSWSSNRLNSPLNVSVLDEGPQNGGGAIKVVTDDDGKETTNREQSSHRQANKISPTSIEVATVHSDHDDGDDGDDVDNANERGKRKSKKNVVHVDVDHVDYIRRESFTEPNLNSELDENVKGTILLSILDQADKLRREKQANAESLGDRNKTMNVDRTKVVLGKEGDPIRSKDIIELTTRTTTTTNKVQGSERDDRDRERSNISISISSSNGSTSISTRNNINTRDNKYNGHDVAPSKVVKEIEFTSRKSEKDNDEDYRILGSMRSRKVLEANVGGGRGEALKEVRGEDTRRAGKRESTKGNLVKSLYNDDSDSAMDVNVEEEGEEAGATTEPKVEANKSSSSLVLGVRKPLRFNKDRKEIVEDGNSNSLTQSNDLKGEQVSRPFSSSSQEEFSRDTWTLRPRLGDGNGNGNGNKREQVNLSERLTNLEPVTIRSIGAKDCIQEACFKLTKNSNTSQETKPITGTSFELNLKHYNSELSEHPIGSLILAGPKERKRLRRRLMFKNNNRIENEGAESESEIDTETETKMKTKNESSEIFEAKKELDQFINLLELALPDPIMLNLSTSLCLRHNDIDMTTDPTNKLNLASKALDACLIMPNSSQMFLYHFLASTIIVLGYLVNVDPRRIDAGFRSLSIGLTYFLANILMIQSGGFYANPFQVIWLVVLSSHSQWSFEWIVYTIAPLIAAIFGAMSHEYIDFSSVNNMSRSLHLRRSFYSLDKLDQDESKSGDDDSEYQAASSNSTSIPREQIRMGSVAKDSNRTRSCKSASSSVYSLVPLSKEDRMTSSRGDVCNHKQQLDCSSNSNQMTNCNTREPRPGCSGIQLKQKSPGQAIKVFELNKDRGHCSKSKSQAQGARRSEFDSNFFISVARNVIQAPVHRA